MKVRKAEYLEWISAAIAFGMLFLFFFQLMPYHLFHKEQTQLFLLASGPLVEYLTHPAALARLAGDFLTQFFYYEGAGPVIVSAVLVLWGTVVYRLLKCYIGGWAMIPAALAVAWEAGRLCGLHYPLSGTLALTGIASVLLFCRWCVRRWRKAGWLAVMVLLPFGYWLFGTGNWSSKWYDKPDWGREYLLALDSEMYFGRQEKVAQLLEENRHRPSSFSTYYYNLLNAQRHCLPDKLMAYHQAASQGLFLPVAPGSSYITICAANEAWYALGDMTMAEHAAMLAMIFSPQHTGARFIKRLAEINLINGDEAAALKYLRLLQKTLCYRHWAACRMPGRQTPEVKQWLERKRRFLPVADTLRSSADAALSLRHLLDSHPDNLMARDYLLCFDLLNKDVDAFYQDYQAYASDMIPNRLYAEGLLVHLASKRAPVEEVKKWKIPDEVMNDFQKYTRLYEANNGSSQPLFAEYGKTYWFYYHFAVRKKPVK